MAAAAAKAPDPAALEADPVPLAADLATRRPDGATAQRRFAEAVARVGGSGDSGLDYGGGGDVGGGEGVGCEVAERSTAAAAVVVTVSAIIRGMAASDGLPRLWETVASGRHGIVWWRGRRSAWRREAQSMAAEAGSAREARAVEMEAGLAQEARPMEGGRIGARRIRQRRPAWRREARPVVEEAT
uniref:DUF834 domain-containing protein n=1 Tax=Oryza meridionalis TaxID=40149 RepID=A0A0E0CJH7_9ORYZ